MSAAIALPSIPKVLDASLSKLMDALNVYNLAAWPEDPAPIYHEAPDVEAIARVIRPVIHDNLVNARIAWVYKRKMGKGIGAKMSLAAGVTGWLAEVDYVCVVAWEQWKLLSPRQKVALVDHEMCHCGREGDDNPKWVIVEHDIEEFHSIASRWGSWHHELYKFRNALKSSQYEFKLETPAEQK